MDISEILHEYGTFEYNKDLEDSAINMENTNTLEQFEIKEDGIYSRLLWRQVRRLWGLDKDLCFFSSHR